MVSSELLLRVSSSSVRITKWKRGAAISADIQAEDAQDHARSYHSATQPHDVEHSRKEHPAGTDTSLPPFRQGFSISTSCAGAARLPRPCVPEAQSSGVRPWLLLAPTRRLPLHNHSQDQ